VSRESIASALFARVSSATFVSPVAGATAWRTASRRLRLWSDVLPDQQPAMFLVEHDEETSWTGRGQLDKTTSVYSLLCYAPAPAPSAVGGTLVNLMLDGIVASLRPDDSSAGVLTLGRQVLWCRIEGRVFKDPGDIDGQALLIVPIRAVWPGGA
jgi:hypothetical protein